MDKCVICLETPRTFIKCPNCDCNFDSGCFRRYLLSTTREPNCPSCRKEYTEVFFASILPTSWRLGEYKNHREEVLLDRQKALLSGSQEEAARIKRIRILQDELSSLMQGTKTVLEKKITTRKCPSRECKGLLDERWMCVICSSIICSKCGEIKSEDSHTCDEDTKSSFQLILRDTKPCPKCGIAIMKIDGCNHMFCTDCKTTFCWRTMEIHQNGNSNPHYHDWIASQGRQYNINRDTQCQELYINIAIIRSLPTMYKLYLARSHLAGVTIYGYRAEIRRCEERLEKLRVSYILNDITEDEWRKTIQKHDKKSRLARYIADILEIFINTTRDFLHTVSNNPSISHDIEVQVENLRNYCNINLEKVKQIYGVECRSIDRDFNLIVGN